ncbi:uncharacterized protein LOC121428952 isoform X2 [Lytechinus variegatus]|uniref:uncharacterized protein LOC121428952 isoform X2 n=1 Tax=Lytechinus variegatus TaxID=7654 RepID=UPI001BB1B50C|nr:uncharacterized protein LOC121428952 isoform X2 [Lytechinus variegatus]
MKHRSSKHVDFKDYKVAAFFTIVTCVSVFANKPYSPCISNTKNHNCSCTTSPPSLPSSPSFCMKCCPACTPPPPTTSPLPPPCKYFCKMCPVIQWMLVSLLCSNTLGWISVALIYNFNKPTKTDPYIQNTPTDHQDITLTQRESQLSSRGSTQDEDTKISENQPSNSMSYENLSCDIPEGPTVDTVLI